MARLTSNIAKGVTCHIIASVVTSSAESTVDGKSADTRRNAPQISTIIT